jgi:acetolactate synthase-1/2/3 large subunit
LLHYPEHEEEDELMCLYEATTVLSEYASDYSATATDAGIVWYVMAQHYFPSPGTAYLSSGSFGSMGMALPYAIGAAAATKERVLAVTGDGSLMMCLSELATLRETKFPVVLVINSNKGYRSIKATQDRYFDGRYLGTGEDHGLFIPSVKEIAKLFGIEYFKAKNLLELNAALTGVRSTELRPIILEIMTYEDQAVEPVVESRIGINGSLTSGGLADMFPRLD